MRNLVKKPQNIPKTPGVYRFWKKHTLLYIGKAENLKNRLGSYFQKNGGAKAEELLREATKVDWIETASEIEALIKEAELIKFHIPKYNIVMRDDKNYFYVGFTKELFPRIFLTHQLFTDVQSKKLRANSKKTFYVGPFTSGSDLKRTLRFLRRIFPYCTCKKAHKERCLSREMGLCPGYCCLENGPNSPRSRKIWIKEYKKSIKNISAVLMGKKRSLLLDLGRKMKTAVKKEDFEKAAQLRDQIIGIENIFSHRGIIAPLHEGRRHPWEKIERYIGQILKTQKKISRVEGYDISNISGTEATGSMVVFIDGFPTKSEYRKFKIKTISRSNDIEMHKEVIMRRLRHPEWQFPDLMVIDGGRAQLNAATTALKLSIQHSAFSIPLVVALAKREEELYTEKRYAPIVLKRMPHDLMHFFQYVRDESHRFAKKYHHKLRELSFKKDGGHPS